MAKIIRVIGGTMLIILGVAGLVLPVLQGWLFLTMGFLLLSVDIPAVKRAVCWLEKRYPRLGKVLQRARSLLSQEAKCP